MSDPGNFDMKPVFERLKAAGIDFEAGEPGRSVWSPWDPVTVGRAGKSLLMTSRLAGANINDLLEDTTREMVKNLLRDGALIRRRGKSGQRERDWDRRRPAHEVANDRRRRAAEARDATLRNTLGESCEVRAARLRKMNLKAAAGDW